MITSNFAVFILSHGRPKRITTLTSLKRSGYTGAIYIIVDNEDSTVDEYKKLYGDKVIVFDKAAIAAQFDEAGIFNDRRAVFYARNASFQIARGLGLEYFLQLDDDYNVWRYNFNSMLSYQQSPIKSLDALFEAILEYYKSIPAASIALSQSGDFMGGKHSNEASKIYMKRKAMNTFFCSVDRPFPFLGRINEDVSAYVSLGNRGKLFFSIMQVGIQQARTQQNSGGMTELYLNAGTYIKSFYTVMFAPSCVKVETLGIEHIRFHHKIDWEKAVPRILSEKHQRF